MLYLLRPAFARSKCILFDFSNHFSLSALSSEGIIVAYHPRKPFPYEHSKPVLLNATATEKEDSILCEEVQERYKTVHYPRGPSLPDCQNMFYTNKHVFHIKPRKTRIASTLPEEPTVRKGL
ncbi:39S ribosomal protein L42, mitochondrial, partial [Trichinella nativa]